MATRTNRRPKQTAPRSRHAQLGFEQLEDRVMLAGNVSAFISGGNLRINGDSLGNEVLVERAGATSVRLTPEAGTTVNGSALPVTLGGFRFGIVLTANGGDDEFRFAGTAASPFRVLGNVVLSMGAGNDVLEFTSFWPHRNLTINTGTGNDQIAAARNLEGPNQSTGVALVVGKNVAIATGTGDDEVLLDRSYFARTFVFNAGPGNDTLDIRFSHFRHSTVLNGAAGFDTLNNFRNQFRFRPAIVSFEQRTQTNPPIGDENDPPTITAVADVTTNVNVATGPIEVTLADDTTAAADITLTAASSNQALVPNANIAITGTGAARTVIVTPAANQTGTATITLTATDDDNATATETFVVTVNGAPTISDVANATINEDATAGPFNITLGDDLTAAGSLVLTATSSDTALVPNANIQLGGSGSARTVTVTPVGNASGSTTITLTVTDASGLTATDTFTLTVNPVNDNPTITAVADVTTNIDTQVGPLGFTINDQETAAGSLTVGAASSNQAVVADSGIQLGGSAGARTVTVTPVAGATGTSTITLTVTDANNAMATETFVVTVNAAPVISDVADVTIDEDAVAGPFNVNVSDDITAAGSLTLTASSSNTTLVPNANIQLGGSGAVRTVTVTPVGNASGSATITLTLTDANGLTATDTFTVTVDPVNDLPVGILDEFDVEEDSGLIVSGNVLANDNDGGDGGALSVTALATDTVGAPVAGDFGTFQINADGSFTYDLDDTIAAVDELLAGEELFDELGYTLSDGTATATSTLRIRIQGAAG